MNDKTLLPDVNVLIMEKLNAYPDDVRELAIQAIRLSEAHHPEAAVADQLQTIVRRLAKQQEEDGQ
ncbi:MAG: hypothetical protein FP810_06445 [Desulfocapsa sp.]|nr:hypothetical protein [Desulfocapsa sp.]MBU3946430.1 hypothetical protein [Pseudomonadota bacterium]MCG2743383.1 hypothetical protein [Desulfobacteraceae bacterium]